METIKQELKKQGLTDGVSFPGWVRGETKERLLKESRIFFFPSYNEGMPMAVLEAMAYGMAILTTDVGNFRQASFHHGRIPRCGTKAVARNQGV